MSDTPKPKLFCRIDTELIKNQVPETEDATTDRLFRFMGEVAAAFALLRKYGLAATIYGSARSLEGSPEALEAEKLGGFLAKRGFTVMTGGGGGIMGAANKGAKDAGGNSVGLNIRLPQEQNLNEHTTDSLTFDHFFSRKLALAFASEVYIFFPGGFGTLDEFFEIVTLIQTGKIGCLPVVLVGKEYWTPLLEWIKNDIYGKYGSVSEADMSIYYLVDSAEEAVALIERLLLPQP